MTRNIIPPYIGSIQESQDFIIPDSRFEMLELFIPGKRPIGPVTANDPDIGRAQCMFKPGGHFVDGGMPPFTDLVGEWVKDGVDISTANGYLKRTLTEKEVASFKRYFTVLICCTPRSYGSDGDFGRLVSAQDIDSRPFDIYYRSDSSGLRIRAGGTIEDFSPNGFIINDTHVWAFTSDNLYSLSTGGMVYFGRPGAGYMDSSTLGSIASNTTLDTNDSLIIGNRTSSLDRGFDGIIHHYMWLPYVLNEAKIMQYLKSPYSFIIPA